MKKTINYRKLAKVVRIFRQFDRTNVRFVFEIVSKADTPMSVTEIVIAFYRTYGYELSQPEISRCLAVLRQAKAVTSEKVGRLRLYRALPGFVDDLNKVLKETKIGECGIEN